MRAYYVDHNGYVREGEIQDNPPIAITINGVAYCYRDRMDNIAIYEEDESPTT